MSTRHVRVDCPHCSTHVFAIALGDTVIGIEDPPGNWRPDSRITLARCPHCTGALLTEEEWLGAGFDGEVFEIPTRLWPAGVRQVHASIPAIVRVSLEEAERCHRAGAFTACAAMCGRALEGIGRHYDIKGPLVASLPQLRERDLIDDRLLEWGDALRRLRNEAAHPSETAISREDSTDLLHFVLAICDYIFVLTARFTEFQERQERARARVSGGGTVEGSGIGQADTPQ